MTEGVGEVLDRARLAAFSGGDLGVERELVDLYVATARGYLDRLRVALAAPAAWEEAAHALKGASANLGAARAAALAREAELRGPSPARLAALETAVTAVAAARP